MSNQTINHDKHYARYAYESLILQQSHIAFEGLWTDGIWYYVVCPLLNQYSVTGKGAPLSDWFDNSCRPVTSPVKLVNKAPEASTRVPERTAEELSQLHGEPLTISDLYREVISALPKKFPLISLTTELNKMVVYVCRSLSEDEKNALNITCENIKIDLDIEIRLDEGELSDGAKHQKAPIKPPDTLALISSRALQKTGSTQLRNAYEDDEEFWIDKRLSLFSTETLSSKEILPSSFVQKTSSCFINATVFPPKNIRTYLPLYQRVVIAMPLAESFENALQMFSTSKADLIELARRGRVQFVLPQSIERYPINFVSDLLEANPASILFSRRLATASIAQTRSRLPFLYPPFGSRERRLILELFASVNDPLFGPIARIIREQLGTMWVGMESNLSTRGAMGTVSHGIGRILGELYHHATGRDARIELITSSHSVEWAAALHAVYCPFNSNGYSDANWANFCASAYSGVKNAPIVNPIQNLDIFIDGLLTLNNDASVLEIDQVFTSKDIDRLGQLLRGVSPGENINEILRSINEKVQKFETNQGRLDRLDILGLGGAVGAVLTGNIYIPLGAWVAEYVLKNADPSRDIGGKALDWMRAINTRTSTDAVLISRLRNKTKSI